MAKTTYEWRFREYASLEDVKADDRLRAALLTSGHQIIVVKDRAGNKVVSAQHIWINSGDLD